MSLFATCTNWLVSDIDRSDYYDVKDDVKYDMKTLGLPSSFGKECEKEEEEEEDHLVNNGSTIENDETLSKYWHQRYQLFSKFDDGIQMDREGWFSVTPEKIAMQIAEACRCDIIVDAFCGVGGNAIQFAQTCNRVIAIDTCEERLRMARHNAEIYGVSDRIDFILGSFFDVADRLAGVADVVFLSPPWGGPEYLGQESYDLESMMMPSQGGAKAILETAQKITPNIAFFIPRNSNLDQIKSWNLPCRVQANWLTAEPVKPQNSKKRKRYSNNIRKIKALTIYFGPFLLEENDEYWSQFLPDE